MKLYLYVFKGENGYVKAVAKNVKIALGGVKLYHEGKFVKVFRKVYETKDLYTTAYDYIDFN